MTILVTGANGGFGSVFLPLLRAHYREPVIGAGRSSKDADNYIKCDFSDAIAINSLIKSIRPSIIFHLVGSFTGGFEIDLQINVLSARHIFESIIAEKLKTRVIIFGSAAEYGAVLAEDNPIPESLPCKPVSFYGLTKNYQTEMAKFYARTSNIDVVIARVFNLAIAGLSPRLFYGRANAMISAYKNNQITQMEFGNLSSERDYIGIEEAVTQLLAIAARGTSGEVYNVGSGVPKTMRSILTEMLSKEGISSDVIVETSSESVGRKGFDVPMIYANTSKVTSILNN